MESLLVYYIEKFIGAEKRYSNFFFDNCEKSYL